MNRRTSDKRSREQQRDLAANRMVLYLGLALASTLLLAYLYRLYNTLQGLQIYRAITRALPLLALGLTALSIFRLSRAGGADRPQALVTPKVQLWLSLLALAGALLLRVNYLDAIKLLYAVIPALCLVYFIQSIYGSAFFLLSGYLLAAGSLLYLFELELNALLWLPGWTRILFGLLLVAMGVAWLLLCLRADRQGGALTLFGRQLQVSRDSRSVRPGYLAGAVVIAAGGLFTQAPTAARYYGLIAIAGTAVLAALYYTGRLMYRE
ncbi:MAG: hypothetical protein GXX99_08195 [Clostridiales bacterium]|nr:hypothetical protein [Clostridiales bacterium]